MARTNFPITGIVNAPGTAGTDFELQTDDDMPTVPFFATVHPSGVMPTKGTAEIVEVTDLTADHATVTRAQRGTTAKNVASGWVFFAGLYAEELDAMDQAIADIAADLAAVDTVDAASVGAVTAGVPAKATPVSADKLPLNDSAASDALKHITFANLATAIAGIISDSAPGTLDTLNELAAALGDDPNFAATITTALADKATGAASSTNNAIPRFAGTTGKELAASSIIIDGSEMDMGGHSTIKRLGYLELIADGDQLYLEGDTLSFYSYGALDLFGTTIRANGIPLVDTTSTQTLTGKRITQRVDGYASGNSSATVSTNIDDYDMLYLAGHAANFTVGAPTGTPTNGQKLLLRIKDNGTARTLTWNAIYRAIGITLPATTVVNKTIYVGMMYNSADTKWDVLSVAQEN